MFSRLGQFVSRRFVLVVLAWLALLVAMLVYAPNIKEVRTRDESSLLPDDVPSRQAQMALQEEFKRPPAQSVVAVVVERAAGLTGVPEVTTTQPAEPGSDWRFIQDLTRRLAQLAPARQWELLSPADPATPFLRGNLLSPASKPVAAVIKADLPNNFVSAQTIRDVNDVQAAVEAASPPPGLTWAVTGSASYGRDYFSATEKSVNRTTIVTVIAVLVVLLLTYRALLAAAVSLLTVAIAVSVSLSLLAIGGKCGWTVSMVVELFTIVIGYGAGVDFSLFFLSRYHEELGRSAGTKDNWARRQAIARALAGTGPAIVASAGTVAAGLALMYLARFKAFSNAGPAVSVSVVVSCLASLTLCPALAYLFGTSTFWPRRFTHDPSGQTRRARGFWARLADFTVRHPLLVLLAGLALLSPLAIGGFRQEVVYDTLADLPADNHSVRGSVIFKRHFPQGESSPVHVMVRLPAARSQQQWIDAVSAVDAALETQGSKLQAPVQEAHSLVHPLGLHATGMLGKSLSFESKLSRLLPAFTQQVVPRHLSSGAGDGNGQCRCARWDVALDAPSYTNRAMDSLDPLAEIIRTTVARSTGVAPADVQVLMSGDSAQMRDVKQVTHRDLWFVGSIVVAAVLVIVMLLIRDLPVTLFVMAATILTYGAALEITSTLFERLFGMTGPDWKVEFFLFVILVAVGQDYNLFMLTRIVEERMHKPLGPATGSAIARTGAIVSCCGLIMAATLGSLATSPLRLLQELGVAFILGLLIDTFLVRPLMVPAFVLLLKRMKPKRGGIHVG
ncbi:MAG: hypothetical protein BIFFINMI_00096 [Phycisphaerae bacterium]|nr:hypothetical protein [Phycisphaerae bacterium]